MASSAIAAKLKEEGNALFVKKEYGLAIAKYSEAIAADGDNSVLYANRAACQLALHQFVDATDDAKQATKLDPLYSKAWARLATARDALNQHHLSIEAWQRAVDTLPKEDLTPGVLKQREQFAAGLENAKKQLAKPEVPTVMVVKYTTGKMPWELAQNERAKLDLSTMEGRRSSVWVILEAYEDFSVGVKTMMATKKINTSRGEGYLGMNAIENLTNGIMRDERVFHIDSNDWFPQYNLQMWCEATRVQAWIDDGPDKVKYEAQMRLRAKGWSDVRPALATTVRAWILRGFLEGGMRGNHISQEELYRHAIDIVEWGRLIFGGVSHKERGAIFADTFLRRLRLMHLEALRQLLGSGVNVKYTLDDMYQQALEMTKGPVPMSVEGPVGPGFVSSFYFYPVGEAHSTIGWYHSQMARKCLPDVQASMGHLHSAAESYLTAADVFPEDDERHVWSLGIALDSMLQGARSLRETTVIMKRIRLAAPKMRKIWQYSALSKVRDEKIAQAAQFEQGILEQLEQGKLQLDDRVAVPLSHRLAQRSDF